MKCIILMGGESSRFWPLNYNGHKALFMLYGKTILEHTIDSVRKLGIKDIIVVRSKDVDISYIGGIKVIEQVKPEGMGDALKKCENLIDDDELFLVINPYHINIDYLLKDVDIKEKTLFGIKTDKPENYGVFEIEKGKVKGIEEKPKNPKSNLRVVGVYILDKKIYQYLHKHKGHYSFEDALNDYVVDNEIKLVELKEEPLTLKYPWQLFDIKRLFLNKKNRNKGNLKRNVVLDDSNGPIIIEEGAVIYENVVLRGPVYIGKNSIIGNNSLIRESIIEEESKIGCFSEIARSIISKGCSFHSGYLGDSILGEGTNIGAGFVSANKRIDRGNIKTKVKNSKMETGLNSLGVITGKNVSIGIKSGTMPGVLLGNNVTIYPGSIVFKNIKDDEIFRSD